MSEHWSYVEDARCKLEQLSSLMYVYGTDYLDVPKPEFVHYASLNYEHMSVLFNLAENLVQSIDEMLEKAVEGAYAEATEATQA